MGAQFKRGDQIEMMPGAVDFTCPFCTGLCRYGRLSPNGNSVILTHSQPTCSSFDVMSIPEFMRVGIATAKANSN